MKHLLVRCFIGLCVVATAASATTVIMCGDQTNDATGVGGNTTGNGPTLNADMFDNLVVSDTIPEPTSVGLMAIAAAWLLRRRR